MIKYRFILIGFLLLICLKWLHAQDSIMIIVNASNPISSLTKSTISKYFLKKITKWENGLTVMPVDIKINSELRVQFSNEFLNKRISSVEAYWQNRIFSGRAIPPPILNDEEEILNFVQKTKGAIGYISSIVSISDYRIKVLNIKDKKSN
jgi:ABC-type phosphate transport system substrate-binding protein